MNAIGSLKTTSVGKSDLPISTFQQMIPMTAGTNKRRMKNILDFNKLNREEPKYGVNYHVPKSKPNSQIA